MTHASPAERRLRFNFFAAMIDSVGWNVGMGLMSHTTILPLFVQRMTPDPLAIGAIPAVMFFGWLIPGILVAGWVDRLRRVKASVMWLALCERIVLLGMVAACPVLGVRNPILLLGVFFAGWFTLNTLMGANTPGYFKLIAKTIPAEQRGRVYGFAGAVSGILGVAGAAAAGWFMKHWGFPNGFAACFFAAWVVLVVTVIPLGFVTEPDDQEDEPQRNRGGWRSLPLLWDDRRLRWLCLAVVFVAANQMMNGFYTRYSTERFGADEAAVAGFNAVQAVAKAVGFLFVGWLADRRGNRRALQFSAVVGLAAALAALGARDLVSMGAVFALAEIASLGWGICGVNYVLELCPPSRSGTYTAIFLLFSGPFRVGGPLVAGALLEVSGYRLPLLVCLGGGMLAWLVVTARLREPRPASTAGIS